jgi:hypothetical protein
MRARGAERGAALVAAVLLVLLLTAAGLGLALTAGLEPAMARAFEGRALAGNAAESALVLTAHALASLLDWNVALAGTWRPAGVIPAGPADTVLLGGRVAAVPVLTHLATCHQLDPCQPADRTAVTADRPWGANNPAFLLVGQVTLGAGPPGAAAEGEVRRVFVWIADDPSETDGLIDRDGGPDGVWPGRDRLVIRAEAYGLQGAHAAAEAVAERRGGLPLVRLRRWHPTP